MTELAGHDGPIEPRLSAMCREVAAIAIARSAGLPCVSEVAGVFGWARPGDLLAVDGERGVVLVHPSPADIERLRRAR